MKLEHSPRTQNLKPWQGLQKLLLMTCENLEKTMAHTKYNRNARTCMADCGGKDQRAQKSKRVRIGILLKSEKPTSWLCSMGEPVTKSIKNMLVRVAPAMWRSTVVVTNGALVQILLTVGSIRTTGPSSGHHPSSQMHNCNRYICSCQTSTWITSPVG